MALKVGGLSESRRNVNPKGTPDSKSAQSEKQIVFHRTLTEVSERQRREKIEELIGNIEAQGKRVAERMDFVELERYRTLIKGFMNEIVSGGFEFSKETTYNSRGRQKVVATVKMVDEELDNIARDLLSGEAENIVILDRVGMIQGLLLDVFA